MKHLQYNFDFEVYDSIEDLSKEDASLLEQARSITDNAYAPYSHFCVGAVAKLANDHLVSGTNQENASFPVGICAERALLASSAALYPSVPIQTMAISYHNHNINGNSQHPISPCGMCRQALLEHETRFDKPIRLILSGQEGKVYIIERSSMLLPLSFTGENLGM